MTAAKDILRDASASAIALLRAADVVLGDYMAWEPESIWVELGHLGVEVPAEARDRLLAAIALRLVPAFYWDAVVFEKTCVAFDGRPACPDILEEASPAAMAWGVVEAAWIRERHGDQDLRHEHEPTAYVAVVLDRAGFVITPTQLAFAEPTLHRRLATSDLVAETRQRWASVDKSSLETLVLEETRVDVQLARLAAVEAHVRARRAAAQAELSRLS